MKNAITSAVRHTEPFGGEKLSKFAVGLTITLIILTGPKIFASFLQVYVIDRIARQQPYDMALVTMSDSIQQVISIIVLAVFIPFFIVFLFWLRQRYANLLVLRHHTTYKPGWAVGSFFVPILNFVRPFEIVKETLKYSDRKASTISLSENLLLYSWWVLFWVNSIVGQIIVRSIPKEGSSIDEFVRYTWMVASSDLVECVLFPLYLLLILRVGEKQSTSFSGISSESDEHVEENRTPSASAALNSETT